MALPSISTPEFKTKIPSTGEPITYRPFLVKEEKILLMAMEGNDAKEIEHAVKTILKNCILDDLSIDELATYDMEYLFLQLRAKSVGEVIELKVTHPDKDKECKHGTDISIKVDDIKVINTSQEKKIMLTDNIGVMMKHPTLGDSMTVNQNDTDAVFEILAKCIDYVFDEENVYNDYKLEELVEWINGLNQEQFQKILKFFESMPKLSHNIKWTCELCGEKDEVKIEGLNNFFT